MIEASNRGNGAALESYFQYRSHRLRIRQLVAERDRGDKTELAGSLRDYDQ